MPRIKVSTVLDEHLFRRAKLESVKRRQPLNELIGEALERYLSDTGKRPATSGIVAGSWGVLRIDKDVLDKLLDEEGGLFDS